MTAPFRLYGAEFSAYSLKLRNYLRFKGLEFEFVSRTQGRQEEVARYAKHPLSPVLVDADDTVLQDSTPTIETLERDHPEPSITPDDPALRFIAALLEDYADEWLSKAMFHYRWTYADDATVAAKRTIDMLFEGADAPEGVEDAVKARMAGRLHHVGSTSENTPSIEGSFTRLVEMLESHLQTRSYLLGGRPSIADFGLAAQLSQLLASPTPGAVLRAQAPKVVAWIERMDNPRAEGGFETLDALRETLAPLLSDEIAGAYLAWMASNADAVAKDSPIVRVDLAAGAFTQKPQRYAAKALAELRRKRAEADDAALAALLGETGCDAFLAVMANESHDEPESDSESDEEGDEE